MTDTSNWQAPESDAILMDCLVNASPQEIIKYDMVRFFFFVLKHAILVSDALLKNHKLFALTK